MKLLLYNAFKRSIISGAIYHFYHFQLSDSLCDFNGLRRHADLKRITTVTEVDYNYKFNV